MAVFATVALSGLVLAYMGLVLPQLDGEVHVRGPKSAIRISRDRADVTHIQAQSSEDAFFGLGWVHAQERGWQLEFQRRWARGELSEILGPSSLETDRLMRHLGIARAASAQWDRMPMDARRAIESYVTGINAFLERHRLPQAPEFIALGIAPSRWSPADSVSISLLAALDLSANWGAELTRLQLLRHLSTEELWQMMPTERTKGQSVDVDLAKLYEESDAYPELAPLGKAVAMNTPLTRWRNQLGQAQGLGSNAWIIDGARTVSGRTLLANDPHIAFSAPSPWYMAHLSAPEDDRGRILNVIGASVPGLPCVVSGRTPGVAWGLTNASADTQDLYLELLNPQDKTQYRSPDGWLPFQNRSEVIRVRGAPDVEIVVRETRHGPVLTGLASIDSISNVEKYALSLRWTALDSDNQTLVAGIRANYARNAQELRTAFSSHTAPPQNLLVADAQGTSSYQLIGRVPIRSKENTIRGVAPAPGWLPQFDWQGWLPSSRLPFADEHEISRRGWFVSANERPDVGRREDVLGEDWVSPERFNRITHLLGESLHSVASVRALQSDLHSLPAQRLAALAERVRTSHPLAQSALEEIRSFDGNMRSDSAAALILAVWGDELTRAVLLPKLGPETFNAVYGARTFRAGLHLILTTPAASKRWCSDPECAASLSDAFERTLRKISELQGDEVRKWRWGKAHHAVAIHKPFSNSRWWRWAVQIESEAGGDPWTVNMSNYWSAPDGRSFAGTQGAGLRLIHDLAEPDQSRFILQTGQSGIPWSSRYRDMTSEWEAGLDRPLRMKSFDAHHLLILHPQQVPLTPR